MDDSIFKVKINKTRSIFFIRLLTLTCFLTNITQMPNMINSGMNRYITLPLWGMICVALLFNNLLITKKDAINIMNLFFIFIFMMIGSQIFLANNYLGSSLVYPFLLSGFIFFIGYFTSDKVSSNDIGKLVGAYTLGALFTSVAVFLNVISTGFSWNDRGYAYNSKNSIAQIILTAIIFLFITYFPKKMVMTLLKWMVISALIVLLLMLKSRGSIIGIPVMISIILLFDKSRGKKRFILLIPVLVFIIILIGNEHFYNLMVNSIMFGGRDASNLDDLSSGRWNMILEFPYLFDKNPFFGIGPYYIESFPLSVLLQHGIVGGLPILCFSLFPIFWMLTNMDRSNNYEIAVFVMACTYLINGLFEELAPLGPGVKCYMLWLMFGLIYGKKKKVN